LKLWQQPRLATASGGIYLSPRPRVTSSKRQKEQARQEKQRAKAQRKQQRKLEAQPAGGPPIDFVSDEFVMGLDHATEPATESATEP
jgi:hypothetical protein